MNPLTYLLISLELTSIVLTAIFFIAWLSFGRRQYALFWSIAFFFAAVQWLLNLSSQKIPFPFEVYWMLVSASSAVTLSFSVAGFRMRAKLPNRIHWYLIAAAIGLAAIAWFLIVDPHVGLRTAIGPFFATLMMGACIHAIAYPRHLQPADWGMIISAGIFGLCEAAAAIAIFSGGSAGTQESLDIYRAINFLSLPAAYTAMGLFTVLILASDMSKEMKALAMSDSLTGVLNLRGFEKAASRALSAARRDNSPLSVIVCDVDHFKSINDRYGHAQGDVALIQFARHLQGNVRGQDIVARIGGEEFVLLLPGTPIEAATAIAERFRASISALKISSETSQFEIQASFGVATTTGAEDEIDHLIKRADEALYRSKRDGRNKVSVAS